MALKAAIHQKIFDQVLKPMKVPGEWKVLVVDHLAMRILSSCSRMTNIMEEGITLIEDLNKRRQPLRDMEAIYLLTPCTESIERFIEDFERGNWIYKGAHVFCTESLNDALFSMISQSPAVKAIKTLKEISIAVLPYESQVFSLDQTVFFEAFFSSELQGTELRTSLLSKCAEQLATLCATLGEYPQVKYRAIGPSGEKNQDFAKMLHDKLDQYKIDFPNMGEGAQKDRSVLLVLDRGFDVVSPLLHECTVQAMAYDLLPIENDVYTFTAKDQKGEEQEKEVMLDETDELWIRIRHLHLADCSRVLPEWYRDFQKDKKMGSTTANVKDLSAMIKKMPQFQKELAKFGQHMDMSSLLMNLHGKTSILCKVEQDLAMGADASGEKLKDALRLMTPQLMNPELDPTDKMRILILHILYNKGITSDNLDKIIASANLKEEDKEAVLNLEKLGIDIIANPKKQVKHNFAPINRKNRTLENTYDVSRWVPYLRDILEDSVEDKLDPKSFVAVGAPRGKAGGGGGANLRWGKGWGAGRGAPTGGPGGAPGSRAPGGPRLIVFILGGISYSEMRCAYEVQKLNENWEILVGASSILTPKKFLGKLKTMREDVEKLQDIEP